MNAFHWRGAPSIFLTGSDARIFAPSHAAMTQKQVWAQKDNPISLPGGAKNLPPKLMRRATSADKLVSGGELGRAVPVGHRNKKEK